MGMSTNKLGCVIPGLTKSSSETANPRPPIESLGLSDVALDCSAAVGADDAGAALAVAGTSDVVGISPLISGMLGAGTIGAGWTMLAGLSGLTGLVGLVGLASDLTHELLTTSQSLISGCAYGLEHVELRASCTSPV